MELKKIRGLIEKDEIKEAIEELQKSISEIPLQNEISNSTARLNSLSKKLRMGVVDFETENIERNKIRNSLLQIISEIERQKKSIKNARIVKENNNFFSTLKPKSTIILIIIFILISLVIIFSNRQNITGIEGDNNDKNEVHISK